jgi:hypothetical protein
MHFGDLKAIGDIHPLRIDLRPPDDGNLSDGTSQSIGMPPPAPPQRTS